MKGRSRGDPEARIVTRFMLQRVTNFIENGVIALTSDFIDTITKTFASCSEVKNCSKYVYKTATAESLTSYLYSLPIELRLKSGFYVYLIKIVAFETFV